MSLEKKYGFWTASALVVGTVVGSGIFFKSGAVLEKAGSLSIATLAWVIGAIAMIFGALTFSEIAKSSSGDSGLVSYTEESFGEGAGFLIGWFKSIFYYPIFVGVIGWVAARYFLMLVEYQSPAGGHLFNDPITWILSVVAVVGVYLMNVISPKIAGKFAVSTTSVKLVPLLLLGLVGFFAGLINGNISGEFFSSLIPIEAGTKQGLFSAVIATAFAYEGWIIATNLHKEIDNADEILPKALFFGTVTVLIIYVLYTIGIAGLVGPQEAIDAQGAEAGMAAGMLFGNIGSAFVNFFVVISVLGTINGLIMAGSKQNYMLAEKNTGLFPSQFSKLNNNSFPLFSSLFLLVMSLVVLFFWHGFIAGPAAVQGLGVKTLIPHSIDISESMFFGLYTLYIFIYTKFIIERSDLGFFKRFLFPILAILGSLAMVYGTVTKDSFVYELLINLIIIYLGSLVYFVNKKA